MIKVPKLRQQKQHLVHGELAQFTTEVVLDANRIGILEQVGDGDPGIKEVALEQSQQPTGWKC
jgi:hypothetical protein